MMKYDENIEEKSIIGRQIIMRDLEMLFTILVIQKFSRWKKDRSVTHESPLPAQPSTLDSFEV
jgi:hypothetical protein